jgi:hypothetical protein
MPLQNRQLPHPSTAHRAYLWVTLTTSLSIAGLCFTATPSHMRQAPSKKEASVEPLTLNFVNAEIESLPYFGNLIAPQLGC